MKKQSYVLSLVSFFLGSMLSISGFAGEKVTSESAEKPLYAEGVEYVKITPVQPTLASPGNVEVIELFWYGCPHCYKFEPYVKTWLKNKPDNVEFIRLPATLNKSWEVHARTYYVAELLGVLDKIHAPFFDAVQKNKRKMRTPDDVAKFFSQYGVEKEKFLKVYNSFAVRTRISRAHSQIKRYGSHGVPEIVINGKYRTNSTLAGGSFEKMLKVVDYLIQKESSAGS